jgi:hypothetical protein
MRVSRDWTGRTAVCGLVMGLSVLGGLGGVMESRAQSAPVDLPLAQLQRPSGSPPAGEVHRVPAGKAVGRWTAWCRWARRAV